MPPRQTKHNSSLSFYFEELREQQVTSTTPTTTRDSIFTPRHAACLLADIPMARQLQRTALAHPPFLYHKISSSSDTECRALALPVEQELEQRRR
ncbi:unnamed protein product [Sphagnum troendelagicum]|uniref:Uncharacterized protein n=1 Tax=Sphagnum troendelagicum TaxID=128251 RepID=A0ABP0T8M4_9BRYO